MDHVILRQPGARKIPELQKIPVRHVDPDVLKTINREGGVGHFNDKNGKWRKSVVPFYDPEHKKMKVGIWKPAKESKPKPSSFKREEQEFLEGLMEYEGSGRHPRVSPNQSKRAKKRLDEWVDGDRPVQGEDV